MDKFLHYTLEQFLMDDQFVDWVKKKKDTLAWEKFVIENPSQKEVIDQARSLLLALAEEPPIPSQRMDDLWYRIDKSTPTSHNTRTIYRRLWIPSIAAMLLLSFITFQFLFTNDDKTWETQMNFADVQLSDGSTVKINAGSKLSYNEKTWDDNRLIKLEGEAFFQVEKGSTFTVVTEFGSVEVLGTSFNVLARNGILDVVCKTGKVRVARNGKQEVLLPGEQVAFNKNSSSRSTNIDRLNWISGEFNYNNKPFQYVLNDVERLFNVEVVVPKSAKELYYNGSFKKDSLEKVLEQITWPMNLKYKISGKKVTLFSE